MIKRNSRLSFISAILMSMVFVFSLPVYATAADELKIESNYTIERKTFPQEKPMGLENTWTIFIYICGSDLETDSALASYNLETLLKAPQARNIRYIVQTGGSEQWGVASEEVWDERDGVNFFTNDLVDPTKLQRWEITDKMTLLDEVELASTASEETLSDFLTWGVENYPAEKMGVILWNHGGGNVLGIFADELFDNQSMTLLQMGEAFDIASNSMTDKFEFVAFDACLMANVESANVLAPYARYLYASEEYIPGYGYGDYATFSNALLKKPGMDGAELGVYLADGYFDFYEDGPWESALTFSVIDLQKLDNVLYALNNMALELKDVSKSPSYLAEISRNGIRSQNYTFPHLVDLGDLAGNLADLAPNTYEDVLKALDEAVVYNLYGEDRKFANGLSVFYPTNETSANSLILYSLAPATPDYLNFVSDFLFEKTRYKLLGKNPVKVKTKPFLNELNNYEMTIDPNTYNYVQSFGFHLLRDLGDSTSVLYGYDNDVWYDPDTGVISDNFEGKWASIDGIPFYITLVLEKDDYSLFQSPILLDDEPTMLDIKWVWDETEPDNGHYEILGIVSGIDPETGLPSRDVKSLDPGDVITPRHVILSTEDLLSEEMVEDTSEFIDAAGKYIFTASDETITYSDKTKMEHASLAPGTYYYQFSVVDIYGGLQTYVPIKFVIHDNGDIAARKATLPN